MTDIINTPSLQSRFRLWAWYTAVLGILVVPVVIAFLFPFFGEAGGPNFMYLFLTICLMLFTLTWLVWGELRTKVIKVSIGAERISVTSFLGLGKTRSYLFAEFDGFSISSLPSNYTRYEFLYLMKGNRKIIKLSAFYHKNYQELKDCISRKLKDQGREPFSYWDEYREIFR